MRASDDCDCERILFSNGLVGVAGAAGPTACLVNNNCRLRTAAVLVVDDVFCSSGSAARKYSGCSKP